MPATARKSAAKRRTPANKKPPAKTPARKPAAAPKPSPLVTEVKYLCLTALGVLLLISVYAEGVTGALGRFIGGLLFGLTGFGAYLLPAVLIVMSLYALFSAAKQISPPTAIKAVVFFWCLIAWPHAFTALSMPEYPNVVEYFKDIYSEGGPANGGFIGALLGNLLRIMLGRVGSCITLGVGLITTLVLLTGRSFAAAVAFIADKLRWLAGGLVTVDDEDWEEEDEDDYEKQPRKKRVTHEAPPRRIKDLPKLKPDLPVIAERPNTERNRVLLVNEEIRRNKPVNPLFKDRSPKPEPPEPAPRDAYIEPPEPEYETEDDYEETPPAFTVKGLVEGASESDSEDWDDSPPFDTEEPPARKAPVFKPPAGAEPAYVHYQYPPIDFLSKPKPTGTTGSIAQIQENSRILEETLRSFKVEAKVVEVSVGPTVTRYDLSPGAGVKVSSIANLSNDLALNLAAQGIRIEAPIPGKAAVGIEVPNKDPQPVLLREIIEDDAFTKFPSRLAFSVGKDIAGSPIVADVARMPHLLIAGATGSGKSVCINTLVTSLLYKSRPDEVKLLMIDPKVVELSVYNGIPHLLIPVVTDPKKASGALSWAVAEMDNRYNLFAEAAVRDLKGYNDFLAETDEESVPMPQIVIIIDELADLMMVAKGEVEDSICRLAQKARAAGIHLIVATQRPSVDVITGLIKANIPSRLAFAVSSGIDSRTVLDMYGAEKLLGKGDMLFLPMGKNKPIRLQGCYISDKEVEGIVDFLKKQTITEYPQEMIERVTSPSFAPENEEDLDEFYHEAVEFLVEKGKASTSLLQRQFRIGYNRASRLIEDLEARGIVGPEDGVKPRKVLITRADI